MAIEERARMLQLIKPINEWESSDVILYDGEIAVSKNTDGSITVKIGDGESTFNELDPIVDINKNTALIYSSSSTYAIGEYCIYDEILYKCDVLITVPEEWNSSHWHRVYITNEFGSGGSGSVDMEMSDVSINAVANKIIKKYVDDTNATNVGDGVSSIVGKTPEYNKIVSEFLPKMMAYLEATDDEYRRLPTTEAKIAYATGAVELQLASIGIYDTTDLSNHANCAGSIALGAGSTSDSPLSFSFGFNANSGDPSNPASAIGSIALGVNSISKGSGSIAIGAGDSLVGSQYENMPNLIKNWIVQVYNIINHTSKTEYDNDIKSWTLEFCQALGNNSIAINGGYALRSGTVAVGHAAIATATNAQALGNQTLASGENAHAEGLVTIASNMSAHAEGEGTIADGRGSHAEGVYTKTERKIGSGGAEHLGAHAEGYKTYSDSIGSHAEGCETIANGDGAHAEGSYTEASGHYSHAGGIGTNAKAMAQTVIGKYNADDNNALVIVGNGSNSSTRSNALTIKNDGSVTIGGNSIQFATNGLVKNLALPSEGTDSASKNYVDGKFGELFDHSINIWTKFDGTTVREDVVVWKS